MIALFSLRSVHEELAQEGPDVTQGTSTGRILVFLGYSGTPVVFGIISYILARPVLDASDAVANASVVRLEPLAATIDGMLDDAVGYAAHKAHFGDPPPK